jgi:hypothetical protein
MRSCIGNAGASGKLDHVSEASTTAAIILFSISGEPRRID